MGSMPPPLIPLPSPTHQSDPSDPFDNLFSDIPLSKPIFIPAKTSERMKRNDPPQSPSSATSDFGAFVSVPPSMDPLQQPLVDMDTQATVSSAYHQGSPSSDFFERFAVEAKERSEKNERRVLDELLEHEDDPLYWIDSQNSHTESTPEVEADALIELDDHPPAAGITASLRHAPELASRSHSSQSKSGTSPPPNHYSYSSPPASNIASTLPRKWMTTFLSSSLPSSSEATHGSTFPRPNLKHGIPRVTHSSPFAPHMYVAPSGAPGFAGDHHWNKAGFEFEDRDTKLGGVELAGRRDATTPVLTSQLADKLRSHLPALPRLAKSWSLLYSLNQHGVSLQTFYARCDVRLSGTLIAIQDSEDTIFGAWMSEPIHVSPRAYYGSGESFLWKSEKHGEEVRVEVYKWTGKNDYVALCESGFISFGGGEGKYGLYLDGNLIDGSSARCPTFDNDILCSSLAHDQNKTFLFECVGVEAWGVTT